MSAVFELFSTGLAQGLVLAIIAIGIMIPFKLLNFADLSAEGAYPLGGALSAYLLMTGLPPLLTTLLASLAGGLLGLGTAFLHLRLKINTLLAGIILSTMLYSVNLRLMGKPNLGLFEHTTLFSTVTTTFSQILILALIVAILISTLYGFLKSEKGLVLRAVGFNPHFVQKQGYVVSTYIFLGLFLGNALNSFAGSLMSQLQQYTDIGMGVGMVIHGLAALMLGESLLGTQTLLRQLLAPVIGALIYQQMQGLALSMGLAPSDLKLMTGAIVLLAISYKTLLIKKFA